MTRSKVQNMLTPDLEQTAAQSPGAVMPTSSRQQTSLKEREREREKLQHSIQQTVHRMNLKESEDRKPHSADRYESQRKKQDRGNGHPRA